MILKVWGDWSLFQTLLETLRSIGDQHGGVSIANVATRWVLNHRFVGAVLVGRCFPGKVPKRKVTDSSEDRVSAWN